ncbi:glycosyltransferase [Flavobacterium faecale]|uniref:Glycosyltransferase n=1 Tax=Flavobacterium faecale TaxID=1355330 RepID=A0A2S1LIZ8_9FLAO|nr:glycosyltransferase [Flavobacterium faecale]
MPAVYEALNQQTTVPKKWNLVLSEEEWPKLILPKFLKKLEQRGLEIIWVKSNTYAVKKLVPVLIKYPDLGIITLDDDIIYESNLIGNLVNNTYAKKGNIVGHVGKTLIKKNNELNMMFRDTAPTNINTSTNQVFLIGWGGIYYPNNSLSPKVKDADAIKKIVPGRGSDIWFWAAALAQNTKQYCITPHSAKNLGIPIPTNDNTKPKDTPASDLLERRFQMAIDYFEIREKLLTNLPNRA